MQNRVQFMNGHTEAVNLTDWQRRLWTPKLEGSPHIWPSNADYVSGR